MKTKRNTVVKEQFLVLTSSCGELSQASASYSDIYDTFQKAKDKARDVAQAYEEDQGDRPSRVWIVQVLAEGFPNGLTWN